jgi:hypothetical protein
MTKPKPSFAHERAESEDGNPDYRFLRYEEAFGQTFAWFLDADDHEVALPKGLVEIRQRAREQLGYQNHVTNRVLAEWPEDE